MQESDTVNGNGHHYDVVYSKPNPELGTPVHAFYVQPCCGMWEREGQDFHAKGCTVNTQRKPKGGE